ncbi:MAG: hypothetical protein AW12_02970 [Candidatus Accumulibacter sp. BA-94]|nr:MAG: hypothetical protein AW12_02970 [Candidatus Accumulibacter sp. BA-94]
MGVGVQLCELLPVSPQAGASVHPDGAGQQRCALADCREDDELADFDQQAEERPVQHRVARRRQPSGHVPAGKDHAQGDHCQRFGEQLGGHDDRAPVGALRRQKPSPGIGIDLGSEFRRRQQKIEREEAEGDVADGVGLQNTTPQLPQFSCQRGEHLAEPFRPIDGQDDAENAADALGDDVVE